MPSLISSIRSRQSLHPRSLPTAFMRIRLTSPAMAISLSQPSAGLLDKLGSLSPGGWKTLVVDSFARELLDHVVGDNDVLELNVTGPSINLDARLARQRPGR
jgi:hypothetical protein